VTDVAVRKLSIALEEGVAEAAARAAASAGLSLSAWMTRAAAHELAVQDGLAAVAEWEAEHGALTVGELAEADRLLDLGPSGRRSAG
jgi:hypothetical protein